MAKLDTDFGGIKDLLEKGGQYQVPRYQRPYSWRLKIELRDLWEDFLRIYKARADGAEDTHFLGSLVIGSGGRARPMGYTPYVVIDGQQRLVTVSLLLAAARDALIRWDVALPSPKISRAERAERETKAAQERLDFTYRYLAHRPAMGATDEGVDTLKQLLRIIPGESDLDAYARCIHGVVRGQGHRVATSYRWFRKKIEAGVPSVIITRADEEDTAAEATEEQLGQDAVRPFEFEKVTDAVLNGLELVSISGVSQDNAYQVFRTINATGLKLDQVDLLRNAFFMILPTKADELYRDVWQPMEKRLADRLEAFFHTEVIRQGENVPRDQVYRSQLKLLKPVEAREESVESLIRRVGQNAAIYADLRFIQASDPTYTPLLNLDATARAIQMRLLAWGADPSFPLILEAGIRLHERRLSPAEFSRLLSAVEALLVRRYVARIPPNDLRSSFGQTMRRLRGAKDHEFVALAVKEILNSRFPADDEIERASMTVPFYRPNKQKEQFLILKRTAEFASGKEYSTIKLGVGPDEYSLEHLLPQGELTPEWRFDLEQWEERLPSDQRRKPDEIWRTYRDFLGNVTLTAYNSELSNKRFADKRAFVRDNLMLPISKDFVAAAIWSAQQIEERSRTLAALVCKVWPLPST